MCDETATGAVYSEQMPHFTFEGQRIAYTEYHPDPPGPSAVTPIRSTPNTRAARTAELAVVEARTVILVHGLLLAQTMHAPLARDLAARGNRVVTVDLLGHGDSDRPRDMWRYSMRFFADQVVALMDHLEVERAVVMGTSLGANTALEIALEQPQRLQGMVIEMPVLDNALLASALTFTPILVALTFGEPLMKLVARGTRAVPRRLLPYYGNVLLDTIRQEPGPGAAVLQGLFFGRVAPHRNERRTLQTPTLVIGHRRDPVHPFSDAGMLAEELPNSRLLEADSLVELRLSPERLTSEIATFLDEVWGEEATPKRRGRRAGGAGTPPSA